jgi:hypothetical protein
MTCSHHQLESATFTLRRTDAVVGVGRMNHLSSLQSSVFSLVKRFVARQVVVLDAMRDLRPDIIMPLENRGDAELWSKLRIEYSKKSQVGYWGECDEWEYFLHGGGCRLTHRQTGEKIQWDAGDLNLFNVDWFVDYLQWLLAQPDDNGDITSVRSILQELKITSKNPTHQLMDQALQWRKQILPILDQLVEKGLLSRNNQRTHYALVDDQRD